MMPADPLQTHVAQEFTHDSPWIACRFDPTGTYVFGGAEDFQVWRIQLASGAKQAYPTNAWVRALAFTGDKILTGGYDGRLIWWPIAAEQPAPERDVAAHEGWIRAMTVSPDGQLLATCGNDQKVKLWQLSDGSLVREFVGHERNVYNVAFHPNGKELVSGDLVARFLHWELDTGKILREFTVPTLHKYDPTFRADYGAFRKDGSALAASGITNVTNAFAAVGNPAMAIVDWATGKETVAHLSKGAIQGKAWGLILHPEGIDIAATGGPGGGHLFFWRPDQKDEFHSFSLGNVARDLDLHPDGLRLATAHHDRKLRISLMGPKAS
jgi:WD40 repeat protein